MLTRALLAANNCSILGSRLETEIWRRYQDVVGIGSCLRWTLLSGLQSYTQQEYLLSRRLGDLRESRLHCVATFPGRHRGIVLAYMLALAKPKIRAGHWQGLISS